MITAGRFKDIKEKGISHMFLERDENGYFNHVYSIHLFSYEDQTIELNDNHTILEFGGKYRSLYNVGLISSWGLLTGIDAFPQICQHIMAERNSIIRATDPSINGFYGFVLGWVANAPWCVSIHADFDKRNMLVKGLSPEIFGSRKLASILERFVLSHALMVMPIRESLGVWAIKNGARPERIRIIPHGVNTDRYRQERSSNLREIYGIQGKKLIVFAGRISKDNYVDHIVDAAKTVIQKNSDTIFLFIGDGPEKEELEQKIARFQISDNVKFLGFLPNDSVIDFRILADVN
ncbi:MAG: glycosyltransferase, partial [Anaerolineaceae bacterium]